MNRYFTLIALFISTSAISADYSEYKELYMANQAGGDIVISLEDCAFPEAKAKGFTNRSYATMAGGKTMEEGCWMAPGIEDAPSIQGVTIIPIVNVWYDGLILPFEQRQFEPQPHTVALEGTI
jgi:hypothetical protein